MRARRSTANRVLTILKAALNHAYHENKVVSDDAWRKVKPFREADSAVVRYLNADECRRIVNACAADFRSLVQRFRETTHIMQRRRVSISMCERWVVD